MTPPPKISPALHAYLTDWLAWVERGAPDGEPYRRAFGLCFHAQRISPALWSDCFGQFSEAYPFGGPHEYHREQCSKTAHLNPARLTWARQTIATAEITE